MCYGSAFYVFALFYLGKASFSAPFAIGSGGEKGGFACCVFNESLWCLGGSSEMFGFVDLTSEPLQWTKTVLAFPRVHHALLAFGPQLIALGGTPTKPGTAVDFLYRLVMDNQNTLQILYGQACMQSVLIALSSA